VGPKFWRDRTTCRPQYAELLSNLRMAFEQRLQTAIGKFLSHREGGQAGDAVIGNRQMD